MRSSPSGVGRGSVWSCTNGKCARLRLPVGGLGSCLLALCLSASVAAAQTAKQDTVTARADKGYGPLGIELDEIAGEIGLLDKRRIETKDSGLASFLVFPKLELDTTHESNLFRDDKNEVDDQIFRVQPSLLLASDWTRHYFRFFAGGDLGFHRRTTSENFEDFRASADGGVDVTDDTQVNAMLGFARGHESRERQDDPGGNVDPIVSYESKARLGGKYVGGPGLLRGDVEARNLDFQDSDGFDADERDRAEYRATMRIGYELLPGTTFFVEPQGILIDYDREFDNSGFEQGSHGYSVLAGTTWDASGVTFFEAAVGYLQRSFEESRFDTFDGINFSLKMIWNPTDMLTVTANAGRKVEQTSLSRSSSILTSFGDAKVDYGLLDSLILSLGVAFRNEDTQETERDDDVLNASLGARYLISRNWYAGMRYGYSQRSSNEDRNDFINHAISLRLGAQF